MFNKYLPEDREAFEDLYRPVESEKETDTYKPEEKQEQAEAKEVIKKTSEFSKLNLKGIMKKLNIGEIGVLPLLLLVFLILDVEDDEKLLIFALAFVLGI